MELDYSFVDDSRSVGVVLTPQRAAIIYDALKLHFSNMSTDAKSLLQRDDWVQHARDVEYHRDRAMIEFTIQRLKHDPQTFTRFVIANIIRGEFNPVCSFDASYDRMVQHQRIMESLNYRVQQDVMRMEDAKRYTNNVEDILSCEQKGIIAPETASILMQFIHDGAKIARKMHNPINKIAFIALWKMRTFLPLSRVNKKTRDVVLNRHRTLEVIF